MFENHGSISLPQKISLAVKNPSNLRMSDYSRENYHQKGLEYVSISILPGPTPAYFVNHAHHSMFKGEVMTESFSCIDDAEKEIKHLCAAILDLSSSDAELWAKRAIQKSTGHGYAILQQSAEGLKLIPGGVE